MRTTASIVAAALLLPLVTVAEPIELGYRYSFGTLNLQIVGGDAFSDEIYTEDFTPFQADLQNSVSNSSGLVVSGGVNHTSAFDNPFSGSGTCSAALEHTAGSADGLAVASDGTELEFSITEPLTYELTLNITAQSVGANVANVEMLFEGPSGTVLNITDPGSYTLSGALEPGEYFFGMGSNILIDYRFGGSPPASLSASTAYDFTMTFVPEPASLWMLCMGAVAIWRRR